MVKSSDGKINKIVEKLYPLHIPVKCQAKTLRPSPKIKFGGDIFKITINF